MKILMTILVSTVLGSAAFAQRKGGQYEQNLATKARHGVRAKASKSVQQQTNTKKADLKAPAKLH